MEHDTLNYNDHSVSLAKLPAVSIHRLASYGLSHLLGNQAASKVVAAVESGKVANTDEAKAQAKAEFQKVMLAALADGTIGQHASRGPSVDPEDAEMERLAGAEIRATLKANNIKAPKGDEAVKFQSGEELTMAQLIERRVEKHGERLRTEAKASLKAKAKAREAIAKKVTGQGAADLL